MVIEMYKQRLSAVEYENIVLNAKLLQLQLQNEEKQNKENVE
ncbi:hypothetical protein TPDSLph2_CDS0016 [Terrisporobacter phage TPDSL_ph2]